MLPIPNGADDRLGVRLCEVLGLDSDYAKRHRYGDKIEADDGQDRSAV